MNKKKISIILSVLLILSSMPTVVLAEETGPVINPTAIEYVDPATATSTGATPTEIANINLLLGVGETAQLLVGNNTWENSNMNWYIGGREFDAYMYPKSHTPDWYGGGNYGYNTNAVRIDNMGRVSGISVGCVTIVAESKDGEYVAALHIVVVPLDQLEEMRLTIGIKEGEFIRLSMNCATATHTSGAQRVEWKSLNPSVASVNKFGKVTGLYAGYGESELAIIQGKDTYTGEVEIIYVRVYRY